MKNKHFFEYFLIFVLTLLVIPANSQPRGERFRDSEYKERIRSMKIAFITERLSLTPAEAEKFWAVYNEAQEAFFEIQEENKEIMRSDRQVADMSEAEATEYAENVVERMERTAQLQRKYHERYLDILPVKKVALLYEAEKDFHKRLFRDMRRRNKQRRDNE